MDYTRSAHPPNQSHPSTQQVPIAVEAVLHFGYPKDLVLSTYQKLSTGSSSNQPANDETEGASGGAPISNSVTAALLMTSVEAALGLTPAHHADSLLSRTQDSLLPSETDMGRRQAEDDLERDGPDQPEQPPSSASPSTPDSHPVVANNENTSETAESSTATSPVSAAGVSSSVSAMATSANVPAGAENQVETSSASHATSASDSEAVSASEAGVSRQLPVPLSTPVSEPTLPQQPPEPHMSTATSTTCSAPANASITGRDGTPAEDKARERQRHLTRLRALRAENRRLKARQLCHQCRQRPVELTFLPCGHFILCQTCGTAAESCPACGKTILADVKTFLS